MIFVQALDSIQHKSNDVLYETQTLFQWVQLINHSYLPRGSVDCRLIVWFPLVSRLHFKESFSVRAISASPLSLRGWTFTNINIQLCISHNTLIRRYYWSG